ncbi:uncharacterized protein LOC126979720 isoform X2 [Leptidea sinapis]|uniref:uncharacterized protein LOC126979720 isoform X2 n=1 Tax=Leptidea sinapis TaxID=189913 RepID=UPI0021C282DE|nr:uncharacterized protein LOC126979720 isoform X2 [Leptidea sinapis]
MNLYKDYLQKLRRWTLAKTCLSINEDIDPSLCEYIRLLNDIKFTDGSYHTYYGDLKKVINSFTYHWSAVTDEGIKEADRLTHTATKEELKEKADRTLHLHKIMQVDFGKRFLPVKSPKEKEIYEEIEIDKIKVSIEEIYKRIRANLRLMEEQDSASLSDLFDQLYDKNKEHLIISRQDVRSSLEIAEVRRSMDLIKDKIEDTKQSQFDRIKHECLYWQQKVEELDVIFQNLKQLSASEEHLAKEERDFLNYLENPELIGEPTIQLSDDIKSKLERLRNLKAMAAKALFTFFSVKGLDRKIYNDQIGAYFIDEYGHQVYFEDFGLKVTHINCKGETVQPDDNELYYYDYNGRYIQRDGEILYQVAPCSSLYKLENDVRRKVTGDCGHSERPNEHCQVTLKNERRNVKYHKTEHVDIKETLKPEVVEYLWKEFGHILPLALHDVALAEPRNPIHYFAHKLLYHRYRHTTKELEKMKQEAQKFRQEIFEIRKDRAIAKSKKWRQSQVKHRKPEESDDTADWFSYNSHIAQQEFIRYLDGYST